MQLCKCVHTWLCRCVVSENVYLSKQYTSYVLGDLFFVVKLCTDLKAF